MNEIRNVIGHLCKHLNILLNVDLKPEYFRLAKFNKNEEDIVETLWNLLNKFSNKEHVNNIAWNVKYHLKTLSYNSLQFFALADDMKSGSRELLLTLGFLIAKGALNEIVFAQIEKTPFSQSYDFENSSVGRNVKSCKTTDSQCKDGKDIENLAKWIKGKIAYNKRLCVEYKLCVDKMVQNINDSTRESYTRTEIIAIYNNKVGRMYLDETERIITILENHEKWLRKEHVFWEWMNSVMRERDRDYVDINFQNVEAFEDAVKSIQK